ncbi:hypothetical protein HK096_002739 [Nowakowskiella sp. JEL0078]|nr:hypothetical protein HK096_002739 [Nowakowskiella sp. JEL0078]
MLQVGYTNSVDAHISLRPSVVNTFFSRCEMKAETRTPLTCSTFRREFPAKFLYCFGNTLAEDYFLYHDNDDLHDLSVLHVGCGDLRSLLHTVFEANRKEKKFYMSFDMNDWQPEIISRNVVMLYALFTDDALTANQLMQFWYSLEMTSAVHDYWTSKIKTCISISWCSIDNDEKSLPGLPFLRLYDSQTESDVKFVWNSWLKFKWNKAELRKRRKAFLHEQLQIFKEISGKTTVDKAIRHLSEVFVTTLDAESIVNSKMITEEYYTVWSSGCIVRGDSLNPSLHFVLPDGSFEYGLHYETNPYEGHRLDLELGLKQSVLQNLEHWIESFRIMKGYIRVVSLGTCHVLQFLDKLIMERRKFDIIETSNLADHVGMLNLLVNCSVLLKEPRLSFLKTCSFLLYEFSGSRTEYLNIVTGMPKEAYSTLLGLDLNFSDDRTWISCATIRTLLM